MNWTPGAGYIVFENIHTYSVLFGNCLTFFLIAIHNEQKSDMREDKKETTHKKTAYKILIEILSHSLQGYFFPRSLICVPSVCYFIVLLFGFGEKKKHKIQGELNNNNNISRAAAAVVELECGKVWEFGSHTLIFFLLCGLICTPAVARKQHWNDFNFKKRQEGGTEGWCHMCKTFLRNRKGMRKWHALRNIIDVHTP